MSHDTPTLHFSDQFVISCGTISVDLSKSLVLLLYCRTRQQYHLPKGRKDVGETLEAAAVRETFEESGYKCSLLPHNLVTLAPDFQVSQAHTEPIAVQQRRSMGAHKLIFWYLAQVDSLETPAVGTQEAWEDFEVRWVAMNEAAGMVARQADQQVVARAVEAVAALKKDVVENAETVALGLNAPS
ncbi:hypothetical protein FQN50_000804 [Emmonsiellopsis sp. PD_5]|nr:hypothetical protein FQN50_000804 [Emmonsiellopsis sp. PD_5]